MTTTTTARAEGPSSHPQAATLEFRDVRKVYGEAAEPAISDLSFEVAAGEICVLVGPSGCGKTTAMRMVNRHDRDDERRHPPRRRVVRDKRPAELRREIGYVIQQIGLFPHATIGDNIATVPQAPGLAQGARARTRRRALELIGLDAGEVRDRYPAQLSGGQRQRVGVARALAADPPLMLMDEPFGAIDPINRERLQNEFLRLQDELRKTVVFVTHDIDEAIKIGDRIAILKAGGVLAQYATPAELLDAPRRRVRGGLRRRRPRAQAPRPARVRDVDLWTAPRVRVGDTIDAARAAMAGSDVPYPLVVDDGGRPLVWLDEDDLRGERIEPGAGSPVLTVDRDDVLRDALSDLLQSEVQYGAVVGAEGRVAGILSIELIHDFLVPEAEGEVEPV